MEIILTGKPASTNHIYKSTCRGKFASVYMSKEGKDLKESYQWQIKSQYKGKLLTGDIDLRIELFFGDSRVRDIDNYNKIVLDACTGMIWKDDSQIMSLLIVKNYDKKNPRVELTIN
jgi:Holliday junction resolvase RusA-like endonuclease